MFKKIKKIKQKVENNKPLMITYKIFKWIFGLFLCLILFVILVQKFSNNNLSIGGVRIFSVATGSMKPEYQIGDIIVKDILGTKSNIVATRNIEKEN